MSDKIDGIAGPVFGYIAVVDVFQTRDEGLFTGLVINGKGWAAEYKVTDEQVSALMKEAKVLRLSQLKGKPLQVEVDRDDEGKMTTIKSIAIFPDVMPPEQTPA